MEVQADPFTAIATNFRRCYPDNFSYAKVPLGIIKKL
jgi:hypothetical protein